MSSVEPIYALPPLEPSVSEPVTRELCVRATAYAARRLRRLGIDDPARAEDFAFEALQRHLSASSDDLEYDRDRYPTLFHALTSTINGLVVNWTRKRSTRRERGDARLESHGNVVDFEGALERQAQLETIVRSVHEAFADDTLVLDLLRSFLRGEDRPRIQSRELGVPIDDIRNAIRRLRHHVRRLGLSREPT